MGADQLPRTRRVLALEAWLGGSHARFLEAWSRHSRHEIETAGLAPRHWKWRMSAGAWELGRALRASGTAPDVLFVSDFVDLAQLAAFLPDEWASIPRVLYMHENQLTYPGRPGSAGDRERPSDDGPQLPGDTSWGFKNVLSCLVADAVVFNSTFHRDEFAAAAEHLLRALPRPNPRAELERVLAEALVIGPGIEWSEIALGPGAAPDAPLRLLFNHRWEHDKAPELFLGAVRAVRSAGRALEVVALGQSFEHGDAHTLALARELDACIVERGFVDDPAAYRRALGTCDAVVSTARHEFYGISVLEAVAAGCTPLVPDRLAYPELFPRERYGAGLYRGEQQLIERLGALAGDPAPLRGVEHRARMRAGVCGESAELKAKQLDELVSVLRRRGTGPGCR